MKNVKHITAIFFVTMILLFKVAGLHALSHHADDDDVQHCEVCHITLVDSLTPLLETESPVLPQVEYYFPEKKINTTHERVVFKNRHLSGYLFTRPPPQFS